MLEQIYRLNRVREITGLSRSWIYLAIKKGEFPEPIKLGKRAIGWPSSVIEHWVKDKLSEK